MIPGNKAVQILAMKLEIIFQTLTFAHLFLKMSTSLFFKHRCLLLRKFCLFVLLDHIHEREEISKLVCLEHWMKVFNKRVQLSCSLFFRFCIIIVYVSAISSKPEKFAAIFLQQYFSNQIRVTRETYDVVKFQSLWESPSCFRGNFIRHLSSTLLKYWSLIPCLKILPATDGSMNLSSRFFDHNAFVDIIRKVSAVSAANSISMRLSLWIMWSVLLSHWAVNTAWSSDTRNGLGTTDGPVTSCTIR